MRFIDIELLLRKRGRWGHRAELWENKRLKSDFRDYFHNKCWYTEVKLIGQDPHIDHFRPKAEIDQYEDCNYNKPLQFCGYYWLKNDPSNYRACCVYANRKTGEGGKSCFFPLSKNSGYLTEGGDEEEIPMLLDPCKYEDVELITFVGNQVASISDDPYIVDRVRISSNIYNLNDPYIKLERGKVWDEIDKIMREYDSGDISENACLRRLRDAVDRRSAFSACAIAAINSFAPDNIKAQLDLSL